MTQYDEIGATYEGVKGVPYVKFVEQPNVLRALEHVQGKRVLDLACGTGYYSRIIRQLGAAEVVGVDISAEMIKHAVEIEAASPLGISYHVIDAAELPVLGHFDLVNAVYLLNYAPDEEALGKMVKGVYQNLAPGGEFFALTANPDYSFGGPEAGRYGTTITLLRQFDQGREVHLTVHIDPLVAFNYYMLTREVYERVLLNTGFREFSWVPVSLSDEVIAQFPSGHWDEAITNPAIIMLRAR